MKNENNVMEIAHELDLGSPSEAANALRFVAQSIGIAGREWITGAALVVECAAFEARYLLEHAPAKSLIWENRRYAPYSLIGIAAIATEDELNLRIAESILQASENGETLDPDMIDAARFFTEVWKDYAAETRASYRSVIADTFGKLTGTGPLTERFSERFATKQHSLQDSAVWLSMAFTEE